MARLPVRDRGRRRHPGGHRADPKDPRRGTARRGLGDPGRRRRRDRLAALRPRRAWRDRADAPPGRRRRMHPARPHPRRGRHLLHALAGIVLVTVLVFAAWRIPGSSTHVPGLGTTRHHHSAPARQLVLHGVGRGTYVEVRRRRASGKVDLQATVEPGQIDRLPGNRFYLLVRTPAGLRVTLDGRAVALPAVHNLRVLVTPQRTTRLRG